MTTILTPQQAKRLKLIKLAAAKIKTERKRMVRDRIDEIKREKSE